MRIAAMVVAALLATVVVASAQVPYIAVYFDPYLTQETKDCPGVVMDTWYVGAVNFNVFITGADFMIEYPPAVTWMSDNPPPVKIGSTPTGISIGFALPLNGYSAVELMSVNVLWNCDSCVEPYLDNQVKVLMNPTTSFLGVTDYPEYNLVPGAGLTALICATIPAEDTTWGQVKALYGE